MPKSTVDSLSKLHILFPSGAWVSFTPRRGRGQKLAGGRCKCQTLFLLQGFILLNQAKMKGSVNRDSILSTAPMSLKAIYLLRLPLPIYSKPLHTPAPGHSPIVLCRTAHSSADFRTRVFGALRACLFQNPACWAAPGRPIHNLVRLLVLRNRHHSLQ